MSVQLSLTEKELAFLDRLLIDNRDRYSNPAYSVLVGLSEKVDKLQFRKSGYSRFNKFDMFKMEKSRLRVVYRKMKAEGKIDAWELKRRLRELNLEEDDL